MTYNKPAATNVAAPIASNSEYTHGVPLAIEAAAAGVCVAELLDRSPAYVPFSSPMHSSINNSACANTFLISVALSVHAAVATPSNAGAPTVKLSNGADGTLAAVQIHSTRVPFVLVTSSVGSAVAEQPVGAMPRACAKTWFWTDWAQAGSDLLNAASEEKGAFCARERTGSRRPRKRAERRIFAGESFEGFAEVL